MPKPARILCSFGAHKLENWEYWQDEPGLQPPDHHTCFQYGVCQRCGVTRDRLQHHWEEEYCTRCGIAQPLHGA